MIIAVETRALKQFALPPNVSSRVANRAWAAAESPWKYYCTLVWPRGRGPGNHGGRVPDSLVVRFPRPRPWVMLVVVIVASQACFVEWPAHMLIGAMLVPFLSVELR